MSCGLGIAKKHLSFASSLVWSCLVILRRKVLLILFPSPALHYNAPVKQTCPRPWTRYREPEVQEVARAKDICLPPAGEVSEL